MFLKKDYVTAYALAWKTSKDVLSGKGRLESGMFHLCKTVCVRLCVCVCVFK